MHPWTLQRLAEERSHEWERAARRAQVSHAARRAGPVGARPLRTRVTRSLGEVLIRTGWRLVGPDAPATGIRPRLALRSPRGAGIGPC
jgi:hypothetical protein